MIEKKSDDIYSEAKKQKAKENPFVKERLNNQRDSELNKQSVMSESHERENTKENDSTCATCCIVPIIILLIIWAIAILQ